ncbi:MAG: hypothetical protein HQL51_15905 [Magnetococcales bacterium]|nr:hypothetical protein [Magnetococcales bacterium]
MSPSNPPGLAAAPPVALSAVPENDSAADAARKAALEEAEEAARTPRFPRWVEWTLLAFIMILGVLVRVEDYREWEKQKEITFLEGQPLLRDVDSYYYLAMARDLMEDRYDPVYKERAVPHNPPRPSPAPLLSTLAAALSSATGWPLRWIAAFSSPALGPLLAIPIFLIGRFLAGSLAGIIAALLTVISPFYVTRSELGWFDTDPLNMVFSFTMAYCFMVVAAMEPFQAVKRYFLVAAACFPLFFAWWDQAPQVVTALYLYGLVLASRRPETRQERLWYWGMGLLPFAAIVYWRGWSYLLELPELVTWVVRHVTKTLLDTFPNEALSIDEQIPPQFAMVVDQTFAYGWAMIVAGVGLLWLIARRPRDMLFLGPYLIIAFTAVFFAKRFIIFISPLLALGMGFLAVELWRRFSDRFQALMIGGIGVMLAVLVHAMVDRDLKSTVFPTQAPASAIVGMQQIQEITPPGALIWTWWDFGNPLLYFTKDRGVVTDAVFHEGERLIYNGMPLAVPDRRLAANFMRFYAKHGIPGIETFLKASGATRNESLTQLGRLLLVGPERAAPLLAERTVPLKPQPGLETAEQWLDFLYPEGTPPIYLFLPQSMSRMAGWWFWFASWDFDAKNGHHPFILELPGLHKLKPGEYVSQPRFDLPPMRVDANRGVVQLPNNQGIPLQLALIYEDKKFQVKRFKEEIKNDHAYALLYEQDGFGLVMDKLMFDSVFTQLSFRVDGGDHFTSITARNPQYQLWEVHPDKPYRVFKADQLKNPAGKAAVTANPGVAGAGG